MGDNTKIAWTDATWNPVVGCTRVSAGCDNCYASALHNRRHKTNIKAVLNGWVNPYTLPNRDRSSTLAHQARLTGVPLPLPPQYDLPFASMQLLGHRLDQPLRWRKPRRVFVNSMSDLFHPDVPDEFIDQIFARMRAARQHVFQVLTKRPERMLAYLAAPETSQRVRHLFPPKIGAELEELAERPTEKRIEQRTDWYAAENWRWPLPNVWLGVSVEDQQRANERIPLLLETPAAVRFVSCEPLLGPIELRAVDLGIKRTKGYGERRIVWDALSGWETQYSSESEFRDEYVFGDHISGQHPALDWVIVGGESGAHARPLDYAWVRRIRNDCRAAGVAYFGKQDYSPGTRKRRLPQEGGVRDQEWPA